MSKVQEHLASVLKSDLHIKKELIFNFIAVVAVT